MFPPTSEVEILMSPPTSGSQGIAAPVRRHRSGAEAELVLRHARRVHGQGVEAAGQALAGAGAALGGGDVERAEIAARRRCRW